METRTTIMRISHEDIVNFLSTATYGSWTFSFKYDKKAYNNKCNFTESDCAEDVAAKILLAGGSIIIYDHYAESEDEFYGALEHNWCGEDGMAYTLDLDALCKGLEKAADGAFNVHYDSERGYALRCFKDFADEESYNLDLPEAEALMNIVLFNELVYG